MEENRDMRRLNAANASVQANLMALINRDCLLNIDKNINETDADNEIKKSNRKTLFV